MSSIFILLCRASSTYGKGSEKDKLEVDFVTPECEQAKDIVKDILSTHLKEYIVDKT